jgi:CheY-like chemotaxis protein
MTILVVDADQAFLEAVANLLLVCGVEEFEMATSTEEALKKISKAFFDIILVNLFLPEMSGLHFANELRRRSPKTKTILLIEDQHQPEINSTGHPKPDFPSILKSLVSRNLPLLLAEEPNSISLNT